MQHLRGETTTTAICWIIYKKDGTEIRGTDHDADITISASSIDEDIPGTFWAGANITASDERANSDSAVDNAEVSGALAQSQDLQLDVSVQDLEAGLFDNAPVLQFLVNWQAPDDGQMLIRRGYLGEVSRDTDQRYTTELRGLKQLLTQIFVRTFSERCQVKRFGDSECKFDLSTVTVTGTVVSVPNAKRINASISDGSPALAAGYFNGGELTFTSGRNAGYMREVKRDDNDDVSGHLSVWERFPYDPQPGDTFTLSPGCPRTLDACIAYGNVVNFRGYGVFITGTDVLMKGAGV